MKVRRFKPEDSKSASKIMIEAFRSFIGERLSQLDLKSFSSQVLRKTSNTKRDNSETVSYVVEEDGRILGYIQGSATTRGLGSLNVVGVDPKFFHKGIGTALMRKMEEFWKRKKQRKVSTCVSAHNTRALVYYLKNRFIPVGYQKEHFMVGVDEIVLDRFL